MASIAQLNTPDGAPASVHIEVAVLGAMLLDGVAISDATGKLKAEDFSLDSHQRLYRCIVDLMAKGRGIDSLTVGEELTRRRELDSIGGPAYLAFLTEGIPRNFNIESYVQIVKDKSLLRQLMGIFHDGQIRASDQSEDAITVLGDVEALLADVADSAIQRGLAGIGEIVASSFGSIDKLYEQGREVTGLATHFIELDRMTSGLQDSELIIIGARPSMGKTALAINFAQNAAIRDGKVVAVFSLEMSKESLLRRLLASEAQVNSRKIQTGFLPKEDKGKLLSALERLMESKLFIDDTPGITLPEMRAKARRLKQQEGRLDLIVIDYLQLMGGTTPAGKKGFENRTQEVSSISRGLKSLAKEMKVPVVAAAQLSRSNEQRTGGDKRPLLSDLRESGSIEQDADVVAFIHRPEYYDRDDEELKGKAEIIIAKQRNGPTGTVHLLYQSDFTLFVNPAKDEDGGY
ncbi:MAG: replicative DNA helicase [Acidobacteriota bacterium]|nr:replicative DNA helicase [Acidobacteriota bacterium]